MFRFTDELTALVNRNEICRKIYPFELAGNVKKKKNR